jgi:hypothetical protein
LRDEVAALLLGSIEAGRLSIFCGAGLSLVEPSTVPSAATLSAKIATKYEETAGSIPPSIDRHSLEDVVRYIYSRNQKQLMLEQLIDWGPFRATHNLGHEALADFLGASVVEYSVTTNFDTLIEQAAASIGESDFMPALDGAECERARDHKPLLKVHGCCQASRYETLWFKEQLSDDPIIKRRIELSQRWLSARLQNRDLLFVGFWSDWSYLNSALQSLLVEGGGRLEATVFVIDPQEEKVLREKAPALWNWAQSAARCHHERESGPEFLDELRRRFSLSFVDRVLKLGEAAGVSAALSTAEAVLLRRDAEGRPLGTPLRAKKPDARFEAVGAAHRAVQARGGIAQGTIYEFGDQTVRIINGGGRLLSRVKEDYKKEPAAIPESATVLCAGAVEDGGVPGNLIRGAGARTLVRPGLSARWVTNAADI